MERLARLDSVSARGARPAHFQLGLPSIYGTASPRKAIGEDCPIYKASCTGESYEADSARLRLAVGPCRLRMVILSVRTRRALLDNALLDSYSSNCALSSPRSHIWGGRTAALYLLHRPAPHCAADQLVSPALPLGCRGIGGSATHWLAYDPVEDRLHGPRAVVSALITPPLAPCSFGQIRSPIRSVIHATIGLYLSMMTWPVTRMKIGFALVVSR
ncbi:hypothetical protein CC78DRAFT_162193 [Lojkania enalia]|uniref:Uncharacterized protein n=1 Tax=Lojkania enalia TaxID=147567 RepID=A0A9P4JWX6_9PLEO|nr:hypothetical protein CC78DRAFT_162193 [Didymosphaeria enalia]